MDTKKSKRTKVRRRKPFLHKKGTAHVFILRRVPEGGGRAGRESSLHLAYLEKEETSYLFTSPSFGMPDLKLLEPQKQRQFFLPSNAHTEEF